MWDLSPGRTDVLSYSAAGGILVPQAGIEPVCPALEGGFSATGPSGKPPKGYLCEDGDLPPFNSGVL